MLFVSNSTLWKSSWSLTLKLEFVFSRPNHSSNILHVGTFRDRWNAVKWNPKLFQFASKSRDMQSRSFLVTKNQPRLLPIRWYPQASSDINSCWDENHDDLLGNRVFIYHKLRQATKAKEQEFLISTDDRRKDRRLFPRMPFSLLLAMRLRCRGYHMNTLMWPVSCWFVFSASK